MVDTVANAEVTPPRLLSAHVLLFSEEVRSKKPDGDDDDDQPPEPTNSETPQTFFTPFLGT